MVSNILDMMAHLTWALPSAVRTMSTDNSLMENPEPSEFSITVKGSVRLALTRLDKSSMDKGGK
jgi:hypothetical protein